MTKQTGMACILIWTEPAIKGNGRRINSMGRVRKPGQMELYMKETTSMERNTGKEHLNGLIMLLTKVTFLIITYMATELINGLMGESILEIGGRIRCMGRVYLSGVMDVDMKAITLMIRRKVKGPLSGLMGGNTLDNGIMENSMERVYI